MLQIEKSEECRKWHNYWQNKIFATSQQLGLEIVLPRCVGAEKDVALAALDQSCVVLRDDGLVDLETTIDKTKQIFSGLAGC